VIVDTFIKIFRITIIVIILFSLMQVTPLDPPVTENTSAEDIRNYTKESLRGVNRENTSAVKDRELKLAEETSYFEDDFIDESNIHTKNNIVHNPLENEIRLGKRENSFVKSFGGSHDDWGNDCKQTPDGGYIIGGMAQSFETDRDLLLLKTDSYGNEVWNKTFGNEWRDWGYFVELTSDGGYIVGGYLSYTLNKNSDGFLVKTDSNGNEEWNRTY
jgi:hypothetical protein